MPHEIFVYCGQAFSAFALSFDRQLRVGCLRSSGAPLPGEEVNKAVTAETLFQESQRSAPRNISLRPTKCRRLARFRIQGWRGAGH